MTEWIRKQFCITMSYFRDLQSRLHLRRQQRKPYTGVHWWRAIKVSASRWERDVTRSTHYVVVDVFDGGKAKHAGQRRSRCVPSQRSYPWYQLIATTITWLICINYKTAVVYYRSIIHRHRPTVQYYSAGWANSIASQKLHVLSVSVCMCVNQGGTNHNRYT